MAARRAWVCLPCSSASRSSSRCRSLKCFTVKTMSTGMPRQISAPRTGARPFIKTASAAVSAGLMRSTYPVGKAPAILPDHALLLRVHWRACLASERPGEIRIVRHRAVHPPLRRRVRVVERLQAGCLGSVVGAPGLSEGEEEVPVALRIAAALLLPQRPARHLQSSDVGDVLPQGQLPVQVQVLDRYVLVVL